VTPTGPLALAPVIEFSPVPPSKKPKPQPDPRTKELKEALEAVYFRHTGVRYKPDGVKDNVALKTLLGFASVEEIVERYEVGVKGVGWKEAKTWAQLNQKWNDLPHVDRFSRPGDATGEITAKVSYEF
jgi:hypothetical protein